MSTARSPAGKLYVHILRRDPSDEYDYPRSQLCLSPHPDDPCDAVCFGYEFHGRESEDERQLFELLAALYNHEMSLPQFLRRFKWIPGKD